jgi:hypothetical protein
MPAVLLEAGSIVNRDEELLLCTAAHRSVSPAQSPESSRFSANRR